MKEEKSMCFIQTFFPQEICTANQFCCKGVCETSFLKRAEKRSLKTIGLSDLELAEGSCCLEDFIFGSHMHMYVSIYICMYVYTYIYTHIYMYAYIDVEGFCSSH